MLNIMDISLNQLEKRLDAIDKARCPILPPPTITTEIIHGKQPPQIRGSDLPTNIRFIVIPRTEELPPAPKLTLVKPDDEVHQAWLKSREGYQR